MFNHIFNSHLFKLSLVVLISNFAIVSFAQKYQHLIIYGQSLSTGQQSWPSLSTTPVAGNYMIGSQVWTNAGNKVLNQLSPLVSNVAAATATAAKNRSSAIFAENSLVSTANHVQLKTGGQYRFIASSCGTSGRTIEELSKEFYTPYYYKYFTDAITYASSITSDIHCPAIIWMQGEYNYTVPSGSLGLTAGSTPTSDKATYKSLLLKLKNNMQTDIKNKYSQSDSPLFITYQTGAQYTRGTQLAIGMAQLEASNENEDIVCAGPVYPMTDRGGHLDPNGYRWYGEMLGKVYYKTKILGEDFKPLQPLEISRTSDPKKVKIKFLVPQLPLVLDEMLVSKITNYGFEVYLNSTKKTISSVTVDNDCVYLTCSTDLTGDVEIVYAGTTFYGNGNLRDSDPYTAFYNYIDLDKKNQNGTYVYERETTETTLRPSYEPKDAAGAIYDKPYPLYNFCVAFYYKLGAGVQVYKVPHLDTGTSTAINQTPANENTTVYLEGGSLQVKTDISNISRIDMMDISGKMVAAFPVENDGQDLYSFQLPALSKGVYFVRIISSDRKHVSKIFVK